ncbi:MAG: class I SAM-dependent methyltransferase [Actinobacteria bacterium]|nr:class I SAM-dependent methyltransferase [Actinomycetota bacterium]
MGVYTDWVLPRLIDRVLDTADFREIRRTQVAEIDGRVLEVGFGAGANVAFLPNTVRHLYAVDPATSVRGIADRRLRARGMSVEYVGLDGARLELADESVDHVVSTMTLCTIPDVERALSEIRRVLRWGGRLHFVDHGRSPDPVVARRQRRLNGLHGRLFGGCHLDRDIPALVRASGLTIDTYSADYMAGPKVMGFLYRGVATK